MTRDNILPWTEYAKEEWERMGISISDNASYTTADPLTVDDEPWTLLVADPVPRVSVVGFALLVLAFAAGVVVGWWLA